MKLKTRHNTNSVFKIIESTMKLHFINYQNKYNRKKRILKSTHSLKVCI